LYNQPDSAFLLAQAYYSFSKKKGLKSKMSKALNIQGIAKYFVGEYDEAITYYSRSLKYRKKVGDEAGVASVLNNIGNVYLEKSDYVLALKYFFESLTIEEKLGNEDGISGSLNNIGLIYEEKGEYDEALSYYFRSLKLKIKTGNTIGESHTLNNIGVVYLNQNNYNDALIYFEKSLKANDGYEDGNIALIKYNIGDIFLDKKDYSLAIINYNEALTIHQRLGNIHGESATLNKLGRVYFSKVKLLKAIYYSKKALLLAIDIDNKDDIMNSAKNLHEFYNSADKPKEALEMYTLYIDTKNEITNDKTNKELIRQAFAYEYDKKVMKDSLENLLIIELSEAKLLNERKKKELAEQKNYILYGGLLLALILGGFIYSKFKVISKQKIIIEEQKKTVDNAFISLGSKNKEILDSIQYAKRIQLAILPSDKLIKEHFYDSFILYKPKDIVAGDFYWMEYRDNKVLFAVADCTGPGVPGAMVSVVCNNGLNRSVREYNLSDPAVILDKTREIVISEFEKSGKEVSDGMDIGFCAYENGILKYAGANIPLWIIRDRELIEYKADKQPIGKYPRNLPYTTHTVKVKANDIIYLATDGYSDQFGGDTNKKLKTKELKKLLLSISQFEMSKQKEMLEESFVLWKGDFEQLDDVCVLGVKIQ
jgi:serine phosphatase RsbU (regulator of sigma subunit)/Tfp pilus assembly protein PilF